MLSPIDVPNDTELLASLLHDLSSAQEPWNVTPFWSTYHDRMVRTLHRGGVNRLQNNYQLLKGYADGGAPTLVPPANPIKRAVFELIPRLPAVSKVIDEYKRMLVTEHGRLKLAREKLSRIVLEEIHSSFPNMRPPGNVLAGHPAHSFEWNGAAYTAPFVLYLARAADFYRSIPPEEVTSLLEIGPGLAWSSLAHATLNPNLRLIVNVDIPSTIYVSTQFLKAVDAFDVMDYRVFRQQGGFDAIAQNKSQETSERPVCIQLPPWAAPKIEGPIDWAHNAFSFMEMEPKVVEAYAEVISNNVTRGVWLLSNVVGHLPGAGGQKDKVTFDLIENAFSPHFEREEHDIVASSKYFDLLPEFCRILRRSTHI